MSDQYSGTNGIAEFRMIAVDRCPFESQTAGKSGAFERNFSIPRARNNSDGRQVRRLRNTERIGTGNHVGQRRIEFFYEIQFAEQCQKRTSVRRTEHDNGINGAAFAFGHFCQRIPQKKSAHAVGQEMDLPLRMLPPIKFKQYLRMLFEPLREVG